MSPELRYYMALKSWEAMQAFYRAFKMPIPPKPELKDYENH